MRHLSRMIALLAALALAAPVWAEEILVLKDGRRIPVARLARRDGQVLFETTKGERFSVPESEVVSPPLDSIPMATPKGAAPAPKASPTPAPAAEPQVLNLKDGRKIPVTRLVRKAGQVLFETTKGERFSVPESEVVSPPLSSIPILEAPRPAPSPAATPAPPTPRVSPPPPPPPPKAPAPPPPPPSAHYPLPELRPLGHAGGQTVGAQDPATEEFIPMPDRWRLGFPRYDRYRPKEGMPWVEGSALDPYNQNLLKADYPIAGNELFLNLNFQSNSNINPRRVAAGGEQRQTFFNQNLVFGAEVFKGDTVFRPKDWAVRVTGVFNYNRNQKQGADTASGDKLALEEGFLEKRLAVLSPSFDFVSLRAGMQNFTSDFRGYLFSENQLGVRLFGNAGSNRHQYNVAFFSMRQRDAASQLHDFESRDQRVLIANWFIQDLFAQGYTTLLNVHVNDDKGIGEDVGRLKVTYLGWHGDGHWGSWNVSHAFYQAFGTDDDNRRAGGPVDVNARMGALELSKDADWKRLRLSFFYASGDKDPTDGRAEGFDAISDNPNLAGGAFMFWTQQGTTLSTSSGNFLLSEKFSLLPNLRSRFTDRANFVNPGLLLANAGLDLRLSPKLKVVTNASYLRFADAAVFRQVAEDSTLDETIGIDLGLGFKLRPSVNENVFVVGGVSTLLPRGGFSRALGSTSPLFSAFAALQLAY